LAASSVAQRSGGGSEGGCGALTDLVKCTSRGSHGLLQRHARPLVIQRGPWVGKQLGGHRHAAEVHGVIVTQSVRERDQLIGARLDLTATHQPVNLRRLFGCSPQDSFEVLGQPNALGGSAELFGAQRVLDARSRIIAVGELLVEAVALPPRPQPQSQAATGRTRLRCCSLSDLKGGYGVDPIRHDLPPCV
jgi:hypothetical protein